MSGKCPPDDPRRCQGVTRDGQCEYLAGENSKFCNFHSQGKVEREAVQNDKNRYILQKEEIKNGYERHTDSLDYLSLRDEIGLVRALIERRLNMATNEAEEQLAIREANTLIQRLESMNISLMKIQQQIGLVLGKDELRHMVKEWATILDEELNGIEDKEARIDKIVERMYLAVQDAGKQPED